MELRITAGHLEQVHHQLASRITDMMILHCEMTRDKFDVSCKNISCNKVLLFKKNETFY